MSESKKKEKEESSYKRYLLKKYLDILKNKRGFHTALISLTIPPTKKISDVTSYLKKEIGESSNIKSKGNRKNVIDSITAILGKLKNIKEFPPNGLIIYSGQVPEDNKPGTESSEIYIIEPPEPLKTFQYYCAAEFLLDPLYDMVQEKGAYGIINIENKEAAIGWIRGTHLEISKTFTSGVHSKHHAGGQSQRRLERLIEEGAQNFYKRVGETANSIFMEFDDLKGIFVSGAGMTKAKFVKKGVLDYRLKDKVLDLIDVSYSGEAGIRETVIKIQDKIQSLRYIQEKQVFNIFMENISKDTNLATYGEKQVRKALEMGAVDILLLSEGVQLIRVHVKCGKCNTEYYETIPTEKIREFYEHVNTLSCPSCQSNLIQIEGELDLVEELGDLAEIQGTKIELLSTETEEGTMLISTFGGIAAILRFKI
ncbi:peptide chain release factor aRF-1 [Promethearchaeum syntrophicum]|uniref:Peptide chain release factor subunit 1 n=1 Tax=Promethearchaeum syntrophicum TaxID=2594042 RepID=A0A5B9D6V3_9ARCH|nr:peptide chain release factor aRF-1 [Candidatus Prometheoarchaeum syntrophicum]QEE14782.1 Peptide chain release factor subunit 1 [Candidatus Prometheoarchaeum syntrophicum]